MTWREREREREIEREREREIGERDGERELAETSELNDPQRIERERTNSKNLLPKDVAIENMVYNFSVIQMSLLVRRDGHRL